MAASDFLLANPAVRITADITGVQSGMVAAERTVDRGLRGIGNKVTALGGQFRKVGLGITLAMAPFAIFAAKGVKAAGDFQFALAQIQARAGLTDIELQKVRESALQLGRDTAFSATEATQGMLELVAAGVEVNDALSIIPAVLDQATAGGLGLKESADGLTDIMMQFSLERRPDAVGDHKRACAGVGQCVHDNRRTNRGLPYRRPAGSYVRAVRREDGGCPSRAGE